ncbi:hypothetical protein LZ30DRAFT_780837 [Colletotrichum cereale]|nr:hypothetical protein LZ30DRAFT_780837 [Colletotrichum cereale]
MSQQISVQAPKASSAKKPKKATTEKSVHTDCAILYGRDGPIIASGKHLDPDSKVQAQLCSLKHDDTNNHFELRIDVPLGSDNEDNGFGVVSRYDDNLKRVLPVNSRRIIIKLPRGDCTYEFDTAGSDLAARFPKAKNNNLSLMTIHMRENSEIDVLGYGLPFGNKSEPALEAWMNENQPIIDDITLAKLISQKSFYLVFAMKAEIMEMVYDEAHLAEPFNYPFGLKHRYNLELYEKIWRGITRNKPFRPPYKYEDDNSALGVMAQAHVQDVLWVEIAANEIRESQLPGYFVQDSKIQGVSYAIINRPEPFVDRFVHAWTRLLDYPVKLLCFQKFGDDEPIHELNAVIKEYSKGISDLKSHATNTSDLVLKVWPPPDNETFWFKGFDNRDLADNALEMGKEH